MSISRSLIAFIVAALIAAFWVLNASAQQMGPHHPGQPSAMHATTPAMLTNSHRMMREADLMMTNAATMMREMNALHTTVNHAQHHAAMGSLQNMLGQMRQLHGNLQHMMDDKTMLQHHAAMKNFQQACQDLRKMAASFESMTRNMSRAMKGISSAARKQ